MKMSKNVLFPALLMVILLSSCDEGKKSVSETIVVDNKVSAVPSSFGQIKFNNAYTGFQFSDTSNAMYIFTKNGTIDAKSETPTSGFFITPMASYGYKEAVNYLVELSLDYKNKSKVLVVSDIMRASEYVNKNAAQFHRFSVVMEDGVKTEVLQGIISKGKNSILFVGIGVGPEAETLKDKFLATFKSIDF